MFSDEDGFIVSIDACCDYYFLGIAMPASSNTSAPKPLVWVASFSIIADKV